MVRLIDADKLNIYDVSPAYGTCVMGVTEEDIELAPTVDAEPVRHGNWVEAGRGVVCSCCGKAYTLAETNYCWECGAKMDKQEGQNGN